MKRFLYLVSTICLVVAEGAYAAETARSSMASQMIASPRAASTASKNQINAMGSATTGQVNNNNASNTTTTATTTTEKKDTREKEKAACVNNNIGMSNTFVWASRYSNLNNYATMVEDVEEPENNTCFVKVEVKSSDPKIDVSDIPSKYYEMGKSIVCGSWADEEALTERILEAKKTTRVLGTVGGVVGGAGIGVGAMELFGNKLIGGKVEGQKALEGQELLRSQLLVLKKDDKASYDQIMKVLREIDSACDIDWTGAERPSDCDTAEYVLSIESSIE